MLEKLGLPAKPSLRGAAWVVDASHCQGCSSQFTFINRKHHCRRCGGIFCNSCTQQRMILRGQGDSPVRICDPCKKLEDAARFEMRYGHKNRAVKGNTKQVSKHEEILDQILGTNGKQILLSGHESHSDVSSDLQKTASSASLSNLNEESDRLGSSSLGMQSDVLNDIGSSSPEELRQQAVEEKKMYKILKGEGKPEEALQAFKRGKELERQAEALEIALRKNRRMASKASNFSSVSDTQKSDVYEESNSKKPMSRKGKEGNDDLAAELRDLGWSDADLHGADKKPTNLTLEGELSNLLGEMPKNSAAGKGTGGTDKTQVIVHKKKALILKREGKLAEAKEELKRAKILEKQLEEQELLGEAEDSDDELSALIRSMGDEKQDDLLLDHAPDPGTDFDHLFGVANDFTVDGNFEVTDDDMNDPELGAALKSFGWSDEDVEHEAGNVMQPGRLNLEALQGEMLALKREALSQKRAGNVAEAMALLKKAKLLEKDLESMQSNTQTFTPEMMRKTSTLHLSGEPSVTADEGSVMETKSSDIKMPAKSKLMIQKELLSLKKKALVLRREGRVEEAEEELKKGKVLEQQLEEMENAPKRSAAKAGEKSLESTHLHEGDPGTLDLIDDGTETEATEQDMHDPALLSVLKNLGWNDDANIVSVGMTSKTSKQRNQQSVHDSDFFAPTRKTMRSKAEIQKELLGLKRKALALRRQGKTEEADEELERAKDLEKEIAEIENANSIAMESHVFGYLVPQERSESKKDADDVQKTDPSVIMNRIPEAQEVSTSKVTDVNLKRSDTTDSIPSSSFISVHETLEFEPGSFGKLGHQSEGCSKDTVSVLPNILHSTYKDSIKKESIHPAIQVSSKTNTSSEKEIFSHSALSSHMVDETENTVTALSLSETPVQNSANEFDTKKAEILAHKRKAVALKREGMLAEAREELRQAKLLEKSLEGVHQAVVGTENALPSTSHNSSVMQEGRTNQAQKPVSDNSSLKQEIRTNQTQKPLSGRDRFKLQQESLSHKRNALKLRREGKIAESEAESELAKSLENQLEELGAQSSNASASIGKVETMDDAVVEDLFDPQLMSALKSVGWGDADLAAQPSTKLEPKPGVDKGGKAHAEKAQLEEQIKAEKLRALNLKRTGKQAEAMEALRSAKRLEKQLGLLT